MLKTLTKQKNNIKISLKIQPHTDNYCSIPNPFVQLFHRLICNLMSLLKLVCRDKSIRYLLVLLKSQLLLKDTHLEQTLLRCICSRSLKEDSNLRIYRQYNMDSILCFSLHLNVNISNRSSILLKISSISSNILDNFSLHPSNKINSHLK